MSYPRRLIPIAAGLAAALWLGAPSGALAQTLDCDDVGTVDNDVCQVSGSLVIGPGEVLELDIDLDVEEDLTIETGGTIRFIDGPPKSLTVGGDLEIQESGTLSSAGDNGTSGANSSTAPGNGQLGTDGLDLDVRVGGSAFIDGHVSAAGGAGGRGGNATGNATSGRGVDAGNGRNGASGGTLTFHVDLDAVIGPTASISTDGGAGGAGGNGQNTASSATGTGGNGGSGGDGGGAGGLSFTVCGVLDVEAEGDLAALLTASGGNGGNGGSGGTGRGSGNFGGNGGNGGDGGDGNDVELHADGDVTIAGSVIAVGGAAGDGGNRGNGASSASNGNSGSAGDAGDDGTITVTSAGTVDDLDATFIPDADIDEGVEARCGSGEPEPQELVLFLHNNPTPPIGNTNRQANLPMNTTVPTAETLYNYDNDSGPGRKISKDSGGHNQTDLTKYQNWRWAVSGALVLSGDADLILHSGMKDFATSSSAREKGGQVRVYLRDCATLTTAANACTLIMERSLSRAIWHTAGINEWMEDTITFDGLNYTVADGRVLELKFTVGNDSGDDMVFAYDTVPNPLGTRPLAGPSQLIIPPPTP